MKTNEWKRLNRKTIYDTPYMKVYEDTVQTPQGVIVDDYSLTKKPDVVMIVTTDTENNLIIEKEYKYAANKTFFTIPAGHMEEGESPLEAAKRELLEETGYGNGEFTLISTLYEYPTKDMHKVYVVRATNVELISEKKWDETESLEVYKMTIPELKAFVLTDDAWAISSVIASFAVCGLLS